MRRRRDRSGRLFGKVGGFALQKSLPFRTVTLVGLPARRPQSQLPEGGSASLQKVQFRMQGRGAGGEDRHVAGALVHVAREPRIALFPADAHAYPAGSVEDDLPGMGASALLVGLGLSLVGLGKRVCGHGLGGGGRVSGGCGGSRRLAKARGRTLGRARASGEGLGVWSRPSTIANSQQEQQGHSRRPGEERSRGGCAGQAVAARGLRRLGGRGGGGSRGWRAERVSGALQSRCQLGGGDALLGADGEHVQNELAQRRLHPGREQGPRQPQRIQVPVALRIRLEVAHLRVLAGGEHAGGDAQGEHIIRRARSAKLELSGGTNTGEAYECAVPRIDTELNRPSRLEEASVSGRYKSNLPEMRATDPRDCGSSGEVTPRIDEDLKNCSGPGCSCPPCSTSRAFHGSSRPPFWGASLTGSHGVLVSSGACRRKPTLGGAACRVGGWCCCAWCWWGVAARPRASAAPRSSPSAVSLSRSVTVRPGRARRRWRPRERGCEWCWWWRQRRLFP
ncbi:hypothetical protein DB31_4811 [Hyalangium minutum]|uniref:Uncharacterized protein n=1 Tax=Hyalangium minutum TaxID=394096 RepID=A0A085VZN5_9BACT|nr:hypothetical protein DB31_4811 [Hyalangium minutum]